ncbi:hypothetical protein KKE26_08400 [bacterium]|nr:hypothetical protein [bacterium]
MVQYNNDYTKEEDVTLWQLHEIRHQLAEQHQSSQQINTIGQHVIKRYNLKNLKIIQGKQTDESIHSHSVRA